MKNNLIYLSDGYKYSHKKMYPNGTEYVYSTWTLRKIAYTTTYDNKLVTHGVEYLIHSLREIWNDFKKIDLSKEAELYTSITNGGSISIQDWVEIQKLDKLPIEIKYVKDGSIVKPGTAILTMENTDPKYYWLVNYLETFCSQTLWTASTTATHAREIYKIVYDYAIKTGTPEFVQHQVHDFSARGMSSAESAVISGIAHLEYFSGTDTINAKQLRTKLYGDPIIGIVPATEHAVMCAGGKDDEEQTISVLLDKYPSGIISIVSDTWDYFNTLNVIYRNLKDKINKRDGKLVVRPDSGKPLHIICGNPNSDDVLEQKGTLEILGDIFGYTLNDKGYKVLNPKIGVIYGDGMTREVIDEMLNTMEKLGWSSDNLIFGVGSYQYQYNTRDTLSYAQKATSIVINGSRQAIFKEPKTDKGKSSQKGLTKVIIQDGELVGIDETHQDFKNLIDIKETACL
jgi:nicotinamide phosphoribosyltransferase